MSGFLNHIHCKFPENYKKKHIHLIFLFLFLSLACFQRVFQVVQIDTKHCERSASLLTWCVRWYYSMSIAVSNLSSKINVQFRFIVRKKCENFDHVYITCRNIVTHWHYPLRRFSVWAISHSVLFTIHENIDEFPNNSEDKRPAIELCSFSGVFLFWKLNFMSTSVKIRNQFKLISIDNAVNISCTNT